MPPTHDYPIPLSNGESVHPGEESTSGGRPPGGGGDHGSPEPEEWPPILPLGDPAPAPPFPVDALPPVARDLAAETADALDCPPDYAGHAALVVAGASAGAAVALEVKPGWLERPCLYAALVGPS